MAKIVLDLCQPLGPCEERNACYRYRAVPRGEERVIDFTAHHRSYHKCPGKLPLYDSDTLMEEDWRESRA